MSDEIISEIDELLDEELPDDPAEVTHEVSEDQKEHMLRLLQHAADELGKSPSIREYRSLDFETSSSTIKRAFGTWNEAKREAGLRTLKRGEGTTVSINEGYFEEIDTAEKAYWLGTLFPGSSLQEQPRGSNYLLIVGRVKNQAHFVDSFADAIDSEYEIYENKRGQSEQDQLQLQITNPYFIGNLIDAGYPEPGEDIGGFPEIDDELVTHFVRGYLESAGYFSSGGWEVTADSLERAETFQEWFEEFGAKRATVSEKGRGAAKVRVSNAFDIRAVFETVWPDQLETEPSWTPYPEKIIDHLQSEHPYPENVPYLSE